jgi:hypothetical protein
MNLIPISRKEKYLKPSCRIKPVLMSITEQPQAVERERRNLKFWLKQPNSLKKGHTSKILPTDVETRYVNDHIDYLNKNLNSYRNFRQIFHCDFSYLQFLSKLKLQYSNCGS